MINIYIYLLNCVLFLIATVLYIVADENKHLHTTGQRMSLLGLIHRQYPKVIVFIGVSALIAVFSTMAITQTGEG
jgi:hypothetical protein